MKKVEKVLLWGSAIALVVSVLFFIAIIMGLSGIGKGRRKHIEEWKKSMVDEFRKELVECYGLEEGDYRIVKQAFSFGSRVAEFRFEVDGKEYLAYTSVHWDFVSDYFLAYDSSELKGLAEERVKASGVLFSEEYEIIAARLDCPLTFWEDGKEVTVQVLPMRIYGEEYSKFLRGEECDSNLWEKVTFVVEVECSLPEVLPSIIVDTYKQELKPIDKLQIQYYRGNQDEWSPETLERERVIIFSDEKSEYKDNLLEKQ